MSLGAQERYHDYGQLERDVSRSLWGYTTGWQEHDRCEAQAACGVIMALLCRQLKRDALMRIMNYVLCRNPELNYYQV